ncbi:MAG: arsenosugar biosynthesis radical SAM protein ArsS [Candidatus Omnitrophica bacterium]|nr:arsenosugar biosynthesis radical SAM protein ArsS [Candidatus Omnitrophota bacterium]
MNCFQEKLGSLDLRLTKGSVEILQVNLGKLCNMSCTHCHVEASPANTTENMDRSTAEAVAAYMKKSGVKTLDLTGGAPEMNPNFRYLVSEARQYGIHVIDRCNLTVFFADGQNDLPEFLASHHVEIIASLPCYLQKNVDRQRGRGAFEDSIKALQKLNRLGYGKPDTHLVLNLVYNPTGPYLPAAQSQLEKDYKERLFQDWTIEFNSLYTITNMPITRYEQYLKRQNQYETYVELLIHSFNPGTLDGLMCRNTLSVGWDGKLYDCDFNQMLEMPLDNRPALTIQNVSESDLTRMQIQTAEHCFGCTAGNGSSCQGALR